MDQRVKGGTPPTTNSTLEPTSAPEDSERDQVAEKKWRGEGENRDVGEKEEEKKGAGRKREGDKGAVLELLIEGRCGSAGQQQLQISGRETSCPEGNVRLRIGLQAKRTKKPPKILESYVCKPTIRTYQRQGRGAPLRGDGEGGVGQQGKTSSAPDEATRDQRSGLDSVQTTSKQTASAASPPLASSSSLSSPSSSSSSSQPLSLLSTFSAASTPASVPAITSQGTKSAKQVPLKLADKTEVNSNGSSERVKKEKLPTVNGQPVLAGHKPYQSPRPPVSTSTHKELSLSNKSRPDSPSSPSVTPKPQSSPTADLSSARSQDQESSPQASLEKKKEKERKAKKEKRKDKKSKRDRLEAERAKSEGRKEEGKKKKKEKGKDGKSRHEQDSRPLKKRKARRPSWTKLVHRAQRAENQEAPSDSQHNSLLGFPQNPKTSLSAKATIQQTDESHPAPSTSLTSSSSPFSSATKPPSPKQSHATSDPSPPASRCPITPARKRGRPKSHSSSLDEPPPRLSPNAIPTEVPLLGCDGIQKAPVLEPSPILQCAAQSKSSPKKRGRPPKRPLPEDQSGDALNRTHDADRSKDFHPPEKGNRQLKIRRLINEMKKRKKRRLQKVMLSGYVGKEGKGSEAADGETSLRMCKSIEATTVHTLSALSSSFGSKLGPQINVSKRGTIYMGKRRGRKPKTQTAPTVQTNSQNSTQSSLFSNPSETSLFSNQPQPPPSHPFPSPSLTHSSGAQSPYSEGSLAEPTSSLIFPHPFSLPSPSSSCTSPRPPSSSSLSPFVKKSCPCQGRHHFPFHQSSCKLSCPTPPLHHTPGSPGHLKEATPSPRSESHSEETLPSDSGIGTDNNSVSERGEIRGARGMLRLGQGSGVILGGQRHPSSLVDRPSPVSSPLSHMPRHTNPITNSSTAERHRERDRHRHRRRDFDCSSSCTCLCPCSCPGHNKCTHSDYYSCLGHNALKRQKNKHKKKHQQLHMQDPEFLAELEDLIGQFSEVHIGRRGWARTGLGQGFDGSGNAAGGRRHHSSSHSLRSNIFRINLNGFYSPHPSPYSANTSFSPQPFYPCQPVHCNRKPDRRQCACPSKFQETIENMGFYSSYPPATTLYHHLPSSYPLPSPHQYGPHQSHHAHFLLNPARFHRRRSRLLREGALGGEVEGDVGGGSGGGPHLSSGFTSSLSCGCGRNEHKHKHKHRHRHCERDMDDEEELHEDEEEDGMEREGLASSKPRSGFILGQGEGGRKGARGMGSMLTKESPWLCENGNDSFSSAAAVTSSSASAERYKHTSLTSLGLGSSHLSSFGGSWGALGQSWTKFGGLGGTGFGNSNPSWRGFSGEQHTGRLIASDGEDDDSEDIQEPHLYRASPSPTHTNLFTSAAMATGGRGLRSGLAAITEMGEKWERRKDERGPERDRGADTVQQVTELELQAKRKRGRKRKHGDSPCHQSVTEDKPECDTPPECFSQSDVDQAPSQPVVIQREERADGPPRKKFLRAGLYSDDYKTTDPPSQAQQLCRESMEYTPEEHEYSLLPAPIHVGKYLRLKRIHFQLPYDVMWLWQHNQLQRQPAVPMKRKRRYCEFSEPDVLSSGVADGSDQYSYTVSDSVSLSLSLSVFLFHSGRLKERTLSSHQTAEENSSDITSLFPHLDMEPLTSSERSFVVKHHVFLVRNWELVRDRQIRMRIERERERDTEAEEEDSRRLSFDGANGDDSHIKSDQPVGVEVTVISSDPHHQSQDTSSLLTASPCPTKTQNRQEEEGEEEKRGEEEVCSRDQRRKRLNDLLLTLQHS
ncbi:Histone-lysine N-methyltransferase ASH1L [Collichthys lucidus]|uniref:Histone-lysine N-methyltransferase ASH1L n=1 Tax=Collichthys lucidus TaxID=240159 RepID=A0A4U5V3D8_COLLU|nr:Histone-lysine N-methyltransferase ASH1L [Collichthys lucidus]